MKRALMAGALLVALATLLIGGGRQNKVMHHDLRDDSWHLLDASAGACRHHINAHPDDYVWGGIDLKTCE